MRIHYYVFPNDVDYADRIKEGCEILNTHCDLGWHYYDCNLNNPDCKSCIHLCIDEVEDIIEGITVDTVVELIRRYGGTGFTWDCQAGHVVKVTDISIDDEHEDLGYDDLPSALDVVEYIDKYLNHISISSAIPFNTVWNTLRPILIDLIEKAKIYENDE